MYSLDDIYEGIVVKTKNNDVSFSTFKILPSRYKMRDKFFKFIENWSLSKPLNERILVVSGPDKCGKWTFIKSCIDIKSLKLIDVLEPLTNMEILLSRTSEIYVTKDIKIIKNLDTKKYYPIIILISSRPYNEYKNIELKNFTDEDRKFLYDLNIEQNKNYDLLEYFNKYINDTNNIKQISDISNLLTLIDIITNTSKKKDDLEDSVDDINNCNDVSYYFDSFYKEYFMSYIDNIGSNVKKKKMKIPKDITKNINKINPDVEYIKKYINSKYLLK